ncbi:iron-sulfur cluster insertion protein ErpA [Halorhodospira halochloris]|uniref:Probable iron binding protein from the HesB_IscA_SufA family n=1 Tax=Halorhodospira halochloris TaxID=1052 RepID=A0A0X8X672_HALHR|nr:iron-sulfur cluster insertion protein ErpA [Halorhodospira halochloris]MBK1652422.1 iron-sulfur cluster insertion protein ErpA [Halorhodospira halochloris]MCG5529527.1 iron-sulfur cluster insertion protein ErpA [Halorhodospira halochloris]MCG5547503.1 iron-sulfur cluster insertion protein ErpA [Halorhodospira halochloris]BAU56314.1 probable iron binding protein from the HesB_IscA_SufA family [Halorhodospira halochloris]
MAGSPQADNTSEPSLDIPLVFRDAAADKIRELIESEQSDDLKLRVFISGGGCSGFQYGFTLEEEVEDDDLVTQRRGVQIVVDPFSSMYLDGAEVDYVAGENGEQFVIRNPNVTTTCGGCGAAGGRF